MPEMFSVIKGFPLSSVQPVIHSIDTSENISLRSVGFIAIILHDHEKEIRLMDSHGMPRICSSSPSLHFFFNSYNVVFIEGV